MADWSRRIYYMRHAVLRVHAARLQAMEATGMPLTSEETKKLRETDGIAADSLRTMDCMLAEDPTLEEWQDFLMLREDFERLRDAARGLLQPSCRTFRIDGLLLHETEDDGPHENNAIAE